MREVISPSTGQRYSLSMICRIYGLARSSAYAAQRPEPSQTGRRGPRVSVSDEQLLALIREVLSGESFTSEGYRKAWARLRFRRIRVGKERVRRLMRDNRLLAPQRAKKHAHGDPAHTGRIVEERPNRMWGTDGTRFETEKDGWCWFFHAIDHADSYVVGHHVAKIGDRFAALEPIRQGVVASFGEFSENIADGLLLRADWGTQYTSETFRGEMRFLGGKISHSFVGEPQCNGVAERFIRTLKEECLWLHRFVDLQHARRVIAEFIDRYNQKWIVERLGYRTPAQARADLLSEAA
jgi:putative transposase